MTSEESQEWEVFRQPLQHQSSFNKNGVQGRPGLFSVFYWSMCAVYLSHESELWKSKAGVLVYKDRGGLKIDLATGQN